MTQFCPMERTLFVTNFTEKVDKNLLYELFLQMGPIYEVTVKTNSENNQVPFAFIEFEDEESVIFACEMMDGLRLYGRKLVVKPRGGTNKAREWLQMRIERGQISPKKGSTMEAELAKQELSQVEDDWEVAKEDRPRQAVPEPGPIQVKPVRRFTIPSTGGKIVQNRHMLTITTPPPNQNPQNQHIMTSPPAPAQNAQNPKTAQAEANAAFVSSLVDRTPPGPAAQNPHNRHILAWTTVPPNPAQIPQNRHVLTISTPPPSLSQNPQNPTIAQAEADAAIVSSLIDRISAITHKMGRQVPPLPQVNQGCQVSGPSNIHSQGPFQFPGHLWRHAYPPTTPISLQQLQLGQYQSSFAGFSGFGGFYQTANPVYDANNNNHGHLNSMLPPNYAYKHG
uniref:RRM domain-containing protein n=1 Tax=Panagrellus redivivus TaxID=6233 RepID=A0A7E4VNQ6_PANRE